MERYLIKYLQEITNSSIGKKWIDYLKVDLDGFIYAYGNNMNKNYPAPRTIDWKFYAVLLRTILRSENANKCLNSDSNILSFVSLPNEIEKEFNLNFIGSIVQASEKKIIYNKRLLQFLVFYSKLTREKKFNEVCTDKNFEELEEYRKVLLEEYLKYNFKGLFVGNGEPFMFKLHLDIFKELNIPSFIFLHGLPGIYKLDTEKKADYLCVWGEQIKENYIQAGFDPDRIIVTGHKRFNSIPHNINLRNSTEDILVTTTSSIDWSPQGWKAENFPIYDRSIIVFYCYSIQSVLQKAGVKHARLRVHPSVDKNWIMDYVDNSFYSIDTLPLNQSLSQATLVLGPTTTVWLESLLNGVNYLVYEPKYDGAKSFLVPPFDGSDKCLQIAHDEQELYSMIKSEYVLDQSIIHRYIQPFDFSKVAGLLKK